MFSPLSLGLVLFSGAAAVAAGWLWARRQALLKEHAQLQLQLQLHRQALEQTPIPIVHFDADLTIVEANRSATQSYAAQPLIGRNLLELEPALKNHPQVVKLLAHPPAETTNGDPDPDQALPAAAENGVLGLIAIGSQRQGIWYGESSHHHQKLKAASTAASQAEESASRMKSEFIANINHEVRTPMNAIIGYTEMLANSKLGAREKRFVSIIHKSSMALVSIFNDIMELSKIDSGRLQIMVSTIRLSSIIGEVEGLFTDLAQEKGIRFSVRIEHQVPSSFILDGIRLKQILQNLVSNAIKFTNQGGVELIVGGHPSKGTGKGFDLRLMVEDTGIGIPASDQKKIFELFQQREDTIAKRYGGVGLGLTLVSRLVRMMGGRIELFSREGEGTRFTIFLDRIPLAKHLPSESLGGAFPVAGDMAIKLLVVDDVDLIKDVFIDFFQDSPFKVLTANNGEEALALASTEQPGLIFMDLNLSGTDGRAVTEALRSRPETSAIPVVVMTGEILEEADYRPLFDDFLQKPFRLEALKEIIRRHAQPLPAGATPLPASGRAGDDGGRSAAVGMAQYWNEGLQEKLVSAIRSGCLSEAASLGAAMQESGKAAHQSQLVEMGEELVQYASEPNILGVERLLARLTGTEHPKQL